MISMISHAIEAFVLDESLSEDSLIPIDVWVWIKLLRIINFDNSVRQAEAKTLTAGEWQIFQILHQLSQQ